MTGCYPTRIGFAGALAPHAKVGIIFCSFSEAVKNHPDLVRKYLGSVVPYTDNFFATLNSAVFSDGSFVYVPNRPEMTVLQFEKK